MHSRARGRCNLASSLASSNRYAGRRVECECGLLRLRLRLRLLGTELPFRKVVDS